MSNEKIKIPLCACGCNSPTQKSRSGAYNQFCLGHNTKHSKTSQASNSGHSGLFQPGNTFGTGRPQGSKNNVTLAAEHIIQGEAEALSRKLVELALAGNVACLKTALERLVPVCKSKAICLPDLPRIESIREASTLTAYILDAVAEGTVSPVEGEILGRSCERHIRALEVRDIEHRLAELEKRLQEKQN